jgi:hypothetical protein
VGAIEQCHDAAADSLCSPVHLRLEPSIWNTSREADLGRAVGQTFLAQDTLISRITVWLPPNFPNSIGAHLYVTGVDTTNGQPDTGDILLDGPTVYANNGVPPGEFIDMVFDLDPPLSLPRPSTYCFFIRTEHCSPGSWFIIANNANPYPNGLYWLTGRITTLSCGLRNVIGGENNTDLLFDITFCSTGTTPTRPTTWGRVKVIYR